MKTTLLLIVIVVLTIKGFSQFTFGVSPGIALNSAYFGYKLNSKVVPYISFQYINGKFNYEESGERMNYNTAQMEPYSETEEFSGSLYIPSLGAKYFFKQKNKIQAYLNLNISKPIISGRVKYDGEVDEELKKEIKSLSLWGGEFGFGMEYLFDENFSLGGEFGLRYFYLKYNESYTREYYNPSTGNNEQAEINEDYKFNLSPTYSRIFLNFYF